MKTAKSIVLLAALLALTLITGCAADKPADKPPRVSSLPESGLFVYTLSGRDFPLRTGVSGQEISSQLKGIVNTARLGGYDAIFFEARPAGDSFYSSKIFPRSAFWLGKQDKLTLVDPLGSLIKEAKLQNIDVYAVINPYYLGSQSVSLARRSPALKYPQDCFSSGALNFLMPESETAKTLNIEDAARLFDKYDIAGIVLDGVERTELTSRSGYARQLSSLVKSLSGIASEKGGLLGVVTAQSPKASALGGASISADFVLPRITGLPGQDLGEDIAAWGSVLGADNIIPLLLPGGYPADYNDSNRLINQLFWVNASGTRRYSVAGLRGAGTDRTIPLLPAAGVDVLGLLGDIPMSYPAALTITRPANTISVTLGSYYIFGLSDPEQPLYMGEREIVRSTSSGAFGALVDLKVGKNTFEFYQGDSKQTVTINRVASTGAAKTSALSSIQPAHFAFIRQGAALTLTCTGPAGGSVTLSVGGVTATMRPRSSPASGTPVVYEATVTLPGGHYEQGGIVKIGSVRFTLTYNGNTTEYTSPGEVYACAQGVSAAVRVVSQNTSVYVDPARDGVFLGQLKPGASDFVTDESTNYVRLASGGFIRKECCEPVVDTSEVVRSVSAVTPINYQRDDLLFVGGALGVPFLIEEDEEGVSITLYNLQDFPAVVPVFSHIFSKCEVQERAGAVMLRLGYSGSERPWGVDVFYDESDAVIAVRQKPKLSGIRSRPLEGLVVLLDPGHGGTDPGALGVAGAKGPNESDLNLAVALVARARLEVLGAKVHLTHEGGETVTLVERMQIAQDIRPDIFISLHHNSVGESTDASRARGVESYYHFNNGKALASKLIEHVAADAGRYRRSANQSYYVVTKMSGFPCVLLELGFVSNPLEYESMTEPYDIFKTAGAVAGAIYELAAGG